MKKKFDTMFMSTMMYELDTHFIQLSSKQGNGGRRNVTWKDISGEEIPEEEDPSS